MKRFWIYWRRLALWSLVVVSWAATQTAAGAEPGKTEDAAPQYVLSYAVVVLGIVVLGLVVLFNPSRRRDKARIDPLEERKPKKVSALVNKEVGQVENLSYAVAVRIATTRPICF